ncbi:unnamed protein product [Cunninghamella blakesleeana]
MASTYYTDLLNDDAIVPQEYDVMDLVQTESETENISNNILPKKRSLPMEAVAENLSLTSIVTPSFYSTITADILNSSSNTAYSDSQWQQQVIAINSQNSQRTILMVHRAANKLFFSHVNQ